MITTWTYLKSTLQTFFLCWTLLKHTITITMLSSITCNKSKHQKATQIVYKKALPFTMNRHICLFPYSSIDNTITTNYGLICLKFVPHHDIHSWTLCKKQGTQLDQTPFSFNFKHHLYFSPYNQLCTICPTKGNG